jgi:galactose-1-phosphate uridylyltransferase
VIYVVEIPEAGRARAWFAYDKQDFCCKMAGMAGSEGERYVYWNEAEAVAAFEGRDPLIAGKAMWRARHALHEQLVALDVVTDN